MKISKRFLVVTGICTAVIFASILFVYPACNNLHRRFLRGGEMSNLGQLGHAIRNYESSHGHLPPQAIRDEDGLPLLSWRVAILPYIEHQTLYKEFHLDEPWDSPHNFKLLEKMPWVYRSQDLDKEDTRTAIQVVVGRGTLFDPMRPEPLSLAEVEKGDGLSNTILLVQAARPVPWTKPEDVVMDDNPLSPKLGGRFAISDSYLITLADGSFLTLSVNTPEEEIRGAVRYNDGKLFKWD